MLAIFTWVLLSVASILFTVHLYRVTFMRKRRPGEPPIAKGSIIWGSAVDFSNHAVRFLHHCRDTMGDIFTIRLVNQHLTVVMDPQAYEPLSKERRFDFDPIQKQVNWNVFGFNLIDPKQVIKDTSRTVRGSYMQRGIRRYVENLDCSFERLDSENNNWSDWKAHGLKLFAARTIFDAQFNTIFGRDDAHAFNPTSAYEHFEVFHHYFNYFWLGMPKKWFPQALKALKGLSAQPGSDELLEREDCSEYIKSSVNYMKIQGQSESDIIGHNLVYLHVNYNTFRVAFWGMYHVLYDQKVYAALMDELNQAIEERLDETTNIASFTAQQVEDLKVLDSIVQETCRLSSGVFMVRFVTEDTWFKTSNSKSHLIRKGDRIAIYPPALHMDPTIFDKPEEFQYDRFIDRKFYKNGQEVKHPVMAFGTLCPGKRYALLQFRWYLMATLTRFDMRLAEGAHAEYDTRYYGHEVLPPVAEVEIQARVKPNHPILEFVRD